MSLPLQTIDRIFARLLVRYGASWMRMWPEGVDEVDIKADWANELDGVPLERIRYALEHLPTQFPPNVMQFRALCWEMRWHEKAAPELERPEPTPEEKERVRQMLARARASITGGGA